MKREVRENNSQDAAMEDASPAPWSTRR